MSHQQHPGERSHGTSEQDRVRRLILDSLTYTVGKDPITATARDWFYALVYAIRERVTARWMETMRSYYRADAKRVYYLSMEFLMGRAMINAVLNTGSESIYRQALQDLGLQIEDLEELEHDAALGNGGLGRLAACFLDSMATLGLAGYGYGIRYEYGMFRQSIENGRQVEQPDNWLRYGNPWEFARPEVLFKVRFKGRVVSYPDSQGKTCCQWVDTEDVMAMAYDSPVPGYANMTVNNMRLWSAKASRDFDLGYFNEGNYIKAVEQKNASENLSKVLYPNDTTEMGRELRLKQQYFFVSASLQDILRRYQRQHESLDQLPQKIAIQLNDTHPAIGVAELMRILVDEEHLDWERAWDIATRVFSYTNHTLMPEALETWPVDLFERLLPRHLQIIYEINHRFLKHVAHRFPGDTALLRRLSLIDEENGRRIRMAHLAVVGSHKVNGVAELHTRLMRRTIFADFQRLWPGRIVNMTNGVTPRRWLNQANPGLAHLITEHIGDRWKQDLEQLRQLEPLAEQPAFRAAFASVKHQNKARLAELIVQRTGLVVDPNSLFDVQIKRIHQYKRQLLNLLHVITLYNQLCQQPERPHVARTVIFAGKAAPGYQAAKQTIHLINDVAEVINNDPRVDGKLKLVFIPNYDVSTAEVIIPAADLSQQISTAGTEASGTGNMKLALNGALTVGTLDGANIEIREAVGEDHLFIFGMTSDQVEHCKREGYRPDRLVAADPRLHKALGMIRNGYFTPEEQDRYADLVAGLKSRHDPYLVLGDYADYLRCQAEVETRYLDRENWLRSATLNVARMGRFSSDRTISEYARDIWHAAPVIQRNRLRAVS